MKRPSFQFYPADWQANSNLRRCSHEERGIWVDVLCLLHDQEQYGVARWTLREIAQAVGCNLAKLQGLVAKGILKGSDTRLTAAFIYTPRSGRKDGEPVTLLDAQDGPVWYSSRMVKDEYVRKHAGASTRFPPKTPQGEAPSGAPSHRHGEDQSDGSTSSSTSTPSVKKPSVSYSEDDMRLAEYVFAGVQRIAPDTKRPKIEKWANTVRLMRECDGLTHRRIAEVFAWANKDSFWKTNVLCVDKLREKFPQLAAKREEAHAAHQPNARPGRSDRNDQALREYFADLDAEENAGNGVDGLVQPQACH